jgi:hypothetical protein
MAAIKKTGQGQISRSGVRAVKGGMVLGDVMIELDATTSLKLSISVDPAASGVSVVPPIKGPRPRANFGVFYDLAERGRLQVACSVQTTTELKKMLADLSIVPAIVSGPIVIKR